eukprot:g9379.t1
MSVTLITRAKDEKSWPRIIRISPSKVEHLQSRCWSHRERRCARLRPAAPGGLLPGWTRSRRSTSKLKPIIEHLLPCPQVSEDFWNLNSTRKRPAKVSPFYLAAWLAQLQAEGNTIFLVLGSLPTPTQPLGTEKHQLENFHELQDLQQRAERSGGNPVAAEPDSEDEGPDWLRAMCNRRISAEQAAASLREMGFKSSQIDIALRLASGDGEVASHFLAVMEPLENPQAEHDAATWARCMQAAVLSLDRAHAPMEFLVQGMLRVATLLDCPQLGSTKMEWEVIGGADKGGILVREGQALSSKACEARLSTGAKVKELQLVSDRLRYELISGTGPTTGWVSTRISGKELLQPAASAAVDEAKLTRRAVDTAATDGSDAEATFSPTLQRRQPCLLTYKRVWSLMFLICLCVLFLLESSVSWLLLCFGAVILDFRERRQMSWERDYVSETAPRVAYWCLGEPNSSIIVLEPGYMSVSATLFFIQQNLAKTTRVCIYDPLGVGFSDGFGMIGFKSDAMAMKSVVDTELARAGGGLQVVVGGHSRGHLTACRFAVDYGHSYGGVSVLGFDGSWCGQRGCSVCEVVSTPLSVLRFALCPIFSLVAANPSIVLDGQVVLPDFEQLDDYPSMKKGTVPTGATPWLKKPLKANPDAKGRLVLFSWTGNRGGQGSAHNFQRAPGRWGEMLKEWEQLEVLYPGRATRMKDALYEDCNAYTKDIATALQDWIMTTS